MVKRATAIAGPMLDGSDMFFNICTSPIKVPIKPIAGAIKAIVLNSSGPLAVALFHAVHLGA